VIMDFEDLIKEYKEFVKRASKALTEVYDAQFNIDRPKMKASGLCGVLLVGHKLLEDNLSKSPEELLMKNAVLMRGMKISMGYVEQDYFDGCLTIGCKELL